MFHVVNHSGEFTFHEVKHSREFYSEEWNTQRSLGTFNKDTKHFCRWVKLAKKNCEQKSHASVSLCKQSCEGWGLRRHEWRTIVEWLDGDNGPLPPHTHTTFSVMERSWGKLLNMSSQLINMSSLLSLLIRNTVGTFSILLQHNHILLAVKPFSF
jgi:hypothetical protein